jgi:hypothetical protein
LDFLDARDNQRHVEGMIATERTFIEGIEIRSVPGRGRGLVATRAFKRHERLFETAAFGFADSGGQAHGCATCLCFGELPLPYACAGGCRSQYCSAECRSTDAGWGHELCCAALARVAAVGERKASATCKASASFLLRAFAARRAAEIKQQKVQQCAEADVGGSAGAATDMASDRRLLSHPTFSDALEQCGDCEGTAECEAREKARERAVKLAALHGGKLIKPHADALSLLRAEANNSYTLRDGDGRPRGWVMFPNASFMNHSCLPSVACLTSGRSLIFEALRDIAAGEELLQCYLMLGSESDDGSTREWGFECECGRCSGEASARELEAFDRAHLCVCGCVTTASMRQACMAAGGVCQCHERNRIIVLSSAKDDAHAVC